ncbi:MAG: hypothetical protein EBX78_06350 [Gammaproteobacteria bacterium]|nr:hypothetical protein [Gammaproteobacteria bacterium]
MTDSILLLSARRTPIGAFQGVLAPATAPQLGAAALAAAVHSAGVSANDVQEVIMGCVLPAGLGQAPARQAALSAGIPRSVPTTTINKMCGSGMKALMMAIDQLRAGDAEVIAAGGLESMSNAPYLLPKARAGYRMGHGEVLDHMFTDGPEWFTVAPVGAIQKVLQRAGWRVEDVDLFEVNEAFAAVAMAAQKDLGIAADKLNVNGGACALGHPIGATGARIVATLAHALARRGLRRGIAALCIGGGEATAIAIERI